MRQVEGAMDAGLYLVGTPIGNLADITERAASTLRHATVCYAEDTRRTGRLLQALEIDVPLRSLHAHNEVERVAEILDRLRAGEPCALVTDAGMPTVSDPGRRVVEAVLAAGLRIVPVPGASAVTTALAAAGLPADRFLFLGFPPRSGTARRQWLERAATADMTVVAFESPRRVGALLADLERAGLAERTCVLCRELTKLHEEIRRDSVAALARAYEGVAARGEITLVFEAGPRPEAAPPVEEVLSTARALAAAGKSTREIARQLQERYRIPRNEAYELSLRAGTVP